MRAMAILLLVVAVFAALGMVPFQSSNVSELSPVEILCFQGGDGVLAVCDGGLSARGATVTEAVSNLHAAAPGRLFMETVDQVVFSGVTADGRELSALGLRPAAGLYRASGPVADPDALGVYLRTHGGGVTLGMLEEDPSLQLPMLTQGEGDTLYIKEAQR